MKVTSCTSSGRRKGVSEVVGALLLIVVVVVAVASLSIFLSKAQANAQNRQNYLTEVQTDNLQFTNAQFEPYSPSVQWELDCASSSPALYYVVMVSETDVNLNDGTKTVVPATLTNGNFYEIHKGVQASYIPGTPGTPGTITFQNPASCVFQPATWDNLTLTIRNLNTVDSGINQVEVGDVWMRNWTEITQGGQVLGNFWPGAVPLDIPAKSSVNVNVNLSNLGASFTKNSSLTVKVISTFGNTFANTYSTPVPVDRAGTTSQNYLVTNRDIITLDGSQSYSPDSTIQEYMWTVSIPYIADPPNPDGCAANAFQNPTYYSTTFAMGETIEYTPESLFPTGLTSDCIDGPIQASLTVVDDNGFLSSSQYSILPQDPGISPPAGITLYSAATCSGGTGSATVQVNNIFGQPAPNVAVVAFGSGGVTITGPSEVTTSSNGQATFSYSCPSAGYLQVTAGELPPLSVTVP